MILSRLALKDSPITKEDVKWNEKFRFKNALSGTIRLGDQWKLVQCELWTGHLAAQVYQL